MEHGDSIGNVIRWIFLDKCQMFLSNIFDVCVSL